MTLSELRTLWRSDWQAMKEGRYVAPLPHPKLFDWADPSRVDLGKKAAAARWKKEKTNG